MPDRTRLAMFHSQYGWYQRKYFQALVDAFDVHLVVPMDERPDDPMPEDLIAASHRVSLGISGVRVGHYTPLSLFRMFRLAWKTIGSSDLVLTSTQAPVHSKVAWIVALLRRRPVCVVVEQWKDYPYEGVLKFIYNGLSKTVIRTATRCFVHGEFAARFVRSVGADPGRIKIYPTMNADVGKGAAIPWPDTDEFRFLFVGRFVPVKGLETLLPAFGRVAEKHPEARLVLYGDGPLRHEIEEMARDFSHQTEIHGRIAPAELPAVMGRCHALILPSRNLPLEYEGWGLVVGEMASAGRPVIVTTAVGSAPELVCDGQSGYVVTEGDVDELYDAMSRLIEDPEGSREMGLVSRALFEEYCDVSRCISLLKEVVE